MLLSIDPGAWSGWALFTPYGNLDACGLNNLPTGLSRGTRVVVEKPRIYPGGRTKAPNDVLEVAINAGEWAGAYKAQGLSVEYVEPATWKGTVPKAIHHPRIWAALEPFEQELVSASGKGVAPKKRENIVDAVGLGLWAVGRGGGR